MKLKTIITITALSLVAGATTYAQENRYKADEGWYLQANIGLNIPFMETNHGKTSGIAVAGTAGKTLTPIWGVEGRAQIGTSKLPEIDDSYIVCGAYVAGTFNVLNAIRGIKVGEESRINVVLFAGPGYEAAGKFDRTGRQSALAVIAGGRAQYSLTEHWGLGVELSGIANGDKLNGIVGGFKADLSLQGLVGVRYSF